MYKEGILLSSQLKMNDHLSLLLEFMTNLEKAVNNWKIRLVGTLFTTLSDHKNHLKHVCWDGGV